MAILQHIQSLVNKVVPPSTRSQLYDNINDFASSQPFLASFLGLQILLSFTPIVLFLCFVVGLLLISLIASIIFSLFWIVVALLLLVPTLLVTISLAIGIWVWFVFSFVAARWIYKFVQGNEVRILNGKRNGTDKIRGGYEDVKAEVK